MKRTLITYDAFEQIEKGSLSHAQRELIEAEDVLARTIGAPSLDLHCYNDSSVIYESENGIYLKAGYEVGRDFIEFKNMEQVIIDEQSYRDTAKGVISEMIDALMEKEDEKANQLFDEYIYKL